MHDYRLLSKNPLILLIPLILSLLLLAGSGDIPISLPCLLHPPLQFYLLLSY